MPGKNYHLCQSVRGALMNWTKREWSRALVDENGRRLPADVAKQWMLDQLAQGREVIPITHKPCEGFSYKTGCPGHEMTEAPRP